MKEILYYISLFVICVVVILFYSRYRCLNKESFKDPLESSIFFILDGWSMTHLLFYMLIGYLFPNYLLLTTFLGILWELFEHYSGKYKPLWLSGWGNCHFTDKVKDNEGWWYGKWSDLFINTIGLLIGQYLKIGKIDLFYSVSR